jgi:hypothetical protein
MSILRPVQPKHLFAVLLSIVIAATLNVPASAASPSTTATSDLIPGPPPVSWTVSTARLDLRGEPIWPATVAGLELFIWGLIDAYQGAQRWNTRHGIIS